jgi:nitrous oxidase accessory protein NosD
MPPCARAVFVAMLLLAIPATARAQSDCRFDFDYDGSVMHLLADCRTDVSIEIQDGWTLDGGTHAIVAVDPPGGTFNGAVIVARGRTAHVINTTIATDRLATTCAEGDSRLRGIYFDGASGEIAGNFIDAIYREPSACEEGNAIEVRNRDRDGTPTQVAISGNYVDQFQKTGIVVHGRVTATIQDNFIGSSVSPRLISPNGIHVGMAAVARVERNRIAGLFAGVAQAGSAVLIMESGPGTLIDQNEISGDPDVGIYIIADGVTVTNNRLVDGGVSGPYDIGIVNLGFGNVYFNNTIEGYRTPHYGLESASPRVPRGQQVE